MGNEESSNDSDIELVIYYDETSGMIQENIQNGQQVSFSGVELSFDYAYTYFFTILAYICHLI